MPILQKRWVAGKQDVYDWAYCPIALDAFGNEVPFVDLSCDFLLPADPLAVAGVPVAVDYFGRLSAGRTKERNIRMHFDEVIYKIKDPAAQAVWRDVTGRLSLGYGCTAVSATAATCASWTVVDSPVENISLYARLMKYGHFQTDPAEVDLWAHGDPALPTQYHPALDPVADYPKFVGEARKLLPDACTAEGCSVYDPQDLQAEDMVIAASLLATGADKTGKITVDLVQYMNRILKVPVATFVAATGSGEPVQHTKAPTKLLYPLIRDCGDDPLNQQTPAASCPLVAADATFAAPANEPFADFSALAYSRVAYFNYITTALRPATTLGLNTVTALERLLREPIADVYVVDQNVPLMDWLQVANGVAGAAGGNIDGFVKVSSDALRAIEFVHNYKIPEPLWTFGAVAQ